MAESPQTALVVYPEGDDKITPGPLELYLSPPTLAQDLVPSPAQPSPG
jgi:hypothetical protein